MYNFSHYMYGSPFSGNFTFIILVLAVWSIVWKGYALWSAAKNRHKGWFIAILILNTVGILEIVYVFGVLKKKLPDVKRDFGRVFSSTK